MNIITIFLWKPWFSKVGFVGVTSFFSILYGSYAFAFLTSIDIGPGHLNIDHTVPNATLTGSSTSDAVDYRMGMDSLTAYSVHVDDYARVEFWAPKIYLKPGFHAKPDRGGGYFRAGIPNFNVNCINLVKPDTVPDKAKDSAEHDIDGDGVADELDNFFYHHGDDDKEFRAFCRNEMKILNHHFVNENGHQLIRFSLKESQEWAWSSLSAMTSDDRKLYYCHTTGDPTGLTPQEETCEDLNELFNDSNFVDKHAIAMVFFLHPKELAGGRERTSSSHLNPDGPSPWVSINYRRVDTNLLATDDGDRAGNGDGNGVQDDDQDRTAAEEHEIGHIFLVHHTWDERVTEISITQDTNIMNYGGASDIKTGHKRGFYCVDTDCDHLCSDGIQGNRGIGFWFEPFDGESGRVCHRYIHNNIDYGATDRENKDHEKVKWSQVEIIYYAAKHYKGTWAP